MERYAHGGGHDPDKIRYDFSVNINPLGLPAGVRQILCEQTDAFCTYPDPFCVHLREVLAQKHRVSAERIVCGNGAIELLYKLLAVKRPKQVLIPVPTFVEYEKAVREQGGQVHYYDMPQPFILTEQVLDHITEKMDMMILCIPNNPTGAVPDICLLEAVVRRCALCNVFLLIDACFLDFVQNDALKQYVKQAAETYANVVVLRAFTKFYAMAGLRLGYMISSDTQLIRQVMEYGPCWNVSVPAQLAGIEALQDSLYAQQTGEWLRAERSYMLSNLRKLPVRVYDSEANYILFYTETLLTEALAQYQIAVRSCENYRGLGKYYYRTAVRIHEDNERLITALRQILNSDRQERKE